MRKNGVKRYVDAGDAEDCGHERHGGHFTEKNDCAAGEGRSDDDLFEDLFGWREGDDLLASGLHQEPPRKASSTSAGWLEAKVAASNTEERIRTDRGFALRFMDASAEHADAVYGDLSPESRKQLLHLDRLAQQSAGRLANFRDLLQSPNLEERLKNDLAFAKDFRNKARDFVGDLGNTDRERAGHFAGLAEKTLSSPDRPRFAARLIGSPENYKHHASNVFGKDISPDYIVLMSGFEEFHSMFNNAEISISADKDVLNKNQSTVQADLKVKNSKGDTIVNMHRTFRRGRSDPKNIICENDIFTIHDEDVAKKGVGLKTFSGQVDNLLKHGVSRIDTHAAGNFKTLNEPDLKKRYSGYYVWPKFGYDSSISVKFFDDPAHASLAKDLVRKAGGKLTIDAKFRLSDLMATPEGQEFWMKHGRSSSLTFDLSPGSTSRRVLSLYRKGKGADDPAGPDRYRLSEGKRASTLISRYLKAGSPTDCGRVSNDGKFTSGNVCATGRNPGQIADEAATRADKWMKTPVGQATIEATKKTPAPTSKTIPVGIAKVVWSASRRQAHGDDVTARILFSQNLAIFKWIAASSSSKLGPAGKAIGGLPVGSLAYLAHAQSDNPKRLINKARVATRATMKRMHGSETPPGQTKGDERFDTPDSDHYSSSRSPRRFATEEEHSESKALSKAVHAVKKYGGYYFAILSVALEKSGGDLDLSVRIADHTLKGTTNAGAAPSNPSSKGFPISKIKERTGDAR